MSHVNLGAEHQCAWLTFSAVHELKQSQVLLHWAVAIGAVGAGRSGSTLLLGYHLSALLVNVGASLFDEPYGKVPQLLEIVGGIVNVCPFEAQPLDVLFYVFYIFRVLLHGVRVVEAQVAHAAVFLGQSEVDGNRLGVSNVQVAIRFWWETRLNASAVLAGSQVVNHYLFNEAHRLFLLALSHCFFSHICIYVCLFRVQS